jgi:protein O-GlcNAc transferase
MTPHLENLVRQTIKSFQDENFIDAKIIITKALESDLNNSDTLLELGIAYATANKLKEAEVIFKSLFLHEKNDVRIPYNLGLVYSLQGNHRLAIATYDLAIEIQPDDVNSYINKASSCIDANEYVMALMTLDFVLKMQPQISVAWSNKGVALKGLKCYDEAIAHYEKALSLKPDYAEAWSNKGITLHELKRYDEAVIDFDQALSLKPDYAEAWFNKGNTLHELKRYDEAIAHYEKAISLKPDYAEAWSNKGITLHELKRYEEAVTHFNQALSLKPDYAEAWSNIAVALKGLKRYDEAIAHYEKALSLKPDYAEAWSNKGVTLHELKRYEEAIAQYEKALSLKPDYAEAWSNKGNTLHELKRYDEAIAHYEKALDLMPCMPLCLGRIVHTMKRVCNWKSTAEYASDLLKQIQLGHLVIAPFSLLSINDNSLLHKKCAHIYAQNKYPANQALGAIPQYEKKEKIRIAYFSPDFRDHPVALLTAELFELHDREKFEVIAFSLFKTPVDDEVNLRLRKGFDRFIDVDGMTDLEVARLARELKVDIAIDLAGPTQHSRTAIFSYRAAPIQVNWLGYPGTIGADFIDYIIADKTVIPPSSQECYFEKVVYLPNTYMVDDSKRNSSTRTFTKYGLGLPEHGFIFCCFNSYQKYNPQILDRWSKLLFTVRDSALWITENNTYFKENLISEFEARGISRGRLVFAQRLDSMGDHLARLSLADLFLDTYPFNAHTTAIDALKAGLPVLTLKGESFASRVASSLLEAIGLPELVTTNQEAYEAMAIELATHPEKITDLRLRLSQNRNSSPLFDTPLFTKHLESAYTEMYKRYQAGLQPEQILVY